MVYSLLNVTGSADPTVTSEDIGYCALVNLYLNISLTR